MPSPSVVWLRAASVSHGAEESHRKRVDTGLHLWASGVAPAEVSGGVAKFIARCWRRCTCPAMWFCWPLVPHADAAVRAYQGGRSSPAATAAAVAPLTLPHRSPPPSGCAQHRRRRSQRINADRRARRRPRAAYAKAARAAPPVARARPTQRAASQRARRVAPSSPRPAEARATSCQPAPCTPGPASGRPVTCGWFSPPSVHLITLFWPCHAMPCSALPCHA